MQLHVFPCVESILPAGHPDVSGSVIRGSRRRQDAEFVPERSWNTRHGNPSHGPSSSAPDAQIAASASSMLSACSRRKSRWIAFFAAVWGDASRTRTRRGPTPVGSASTIGDRATISQPSSCFQNSASPAGQRRQVGRLRAPSHLPACRRLGADTRFLRRRAGFPEHPAAPHQGLRQEGRRCEDQVRALPGTIRITDDWETQIQVTLPRQLQACFVAPWLSVSIWHLSAASRIPHAAAGSRHRRRYFPSTCFKPTATVMPITLQWDWAH